MFWYLEKIVKLVNALNQYYCSKLQQHACLNKHLMDSCKIYL